MHREKKTLQPYVIHGIITEMCDIIIYMRGTVSVPDTIGVTVSVPDIGTWRSSVTDGEADLLRP